MSRTDPITVRAAAPRALDVVLGGGLLVAALDIAYAMTYWQVAAGVAPRRILQSIAAGVLGRDAFAGGDASAALGAALHVGIALVIAAVFLFACRRWPALLRRPLLAGPAYGALVYLVMNHVVVPLSRAMPGSADLGWLGANVVGHLLLVGLPLAWLARRSARAR